MARRFGFVSLTLLAILWTPGRSHAQVVGGLVAEQVSLAPVRGAVVVLLRASGSDRLETVGMTTTDAAGAFVLTVPGPGTYRVQADLGGLTTALSQPVEIDAGSEGTRDLALLLPSPLLAMGLSCQAEAGDGTAALVGLVRDPEEDVALPGARVTTTWQEGRIVRRLEAESDAAGRYRICGLPAGAEDVQLQVEFLGRTGAYGTVDVEVPAVIFRDLAVPVASTAQEPKDVIQEQILMQAAAHSLGDLHGLLKDQLSGRPLPFAVVHVRGTPHQTLTDSAGRFVFQNLTPAAYTLEIRNLGYAVRSDSVQIPPGKDVFLILAVAPQAVELEGLEVTTRSQVEQTARLTPFRMDLAFGEEMALEEERGARAFEVLRRASPGLRVTEINREAGPPTVCIQTNRRIQSLTIFRDPGDRIDLIDSSLPTKRCDNVQVVVDGIKIPDGPDYLLHTPASEIESMEFVSPVQAQILYGTGGNTSNGVVVVYTRGRGPYASPLRNVRR